MHEIQAQKLNVGRLEENFDRTAQNMREQIQSRMAGFFQHFLPSIHASIERLEIHTDVVTTGTIMETKNCTD